MAEVVACRSDNGVLLRLRWSAAPRLHEVLGELPAVGAEVTIWEELDEQLKAADELDQAPLPSTSPAGEVSRGDR